MTQEQNPPEAGTDDYHLHVGPSVLPRHPQGTCMTLAEALHRAYGQRYAVVYRLGDDGRPEPVIADAGNPAEMIHVPRSRRMRQETKPDRQAIKSI